MASLMQKLGDLARSPKGRQLTDQAKRYAEKPENRRKLEGVLQRFTKSGGNKRPPAAR